MHLDPLLAIRFLLLPGYVLFTLGTEEGGPGAQKQEVTWTADLE